MGKARSLLRAFFYIGLSYHVFGGQRTARPTRVRLLFLVWTIPKTLKPESF